MSSRIEPPPVLTRPQKKKHDAAMKRAPTDEKDVKLKTRLMEQQQKRKQDMAASIANRMQFLQSTRAKNYRMENDRLVGLLESGPMAYANDGAYRPIQLSQQMRRNLINRANVAHYRATNPPQPIIGTQGRYLNPV
jgi:hypothetical protein